MRKSGAHDLRMILSRVTGRLMAVPYRGERARDRYRPTHQPVLTKRPTKKMHRKKWISIGELKGIMWGFTQVLPEFNKAVSGE
jgi:hypothetical protein